MKFAVWAFGAVLVALVASCNNSNPTANQVTVEAVNNYGSTCPIIVNLDGGAAVTLANGATFNFLSVSTGSHTFNFSTNGSCGGGSCVFTNNGLTKFSVTFNVSTGNAYIGAVMQTGSICGSLLEQGP